MTTASSSPTTDPVHTQLQRIEAQIRGLRLLHEAGHPRSGLIDLLTATHAAVSDLVVALGTQESASRAAADPLGRCPDVAGRGQVAVRYRFHDVGGG